MDDIHLFADAHEAILRHPLRGFRVRGVFDYHGFADSPVATCRHPLRGLACLSSTAHGFADSPVAICRHPLRGLRHSI
jgi:hypothetical protein